MFSIWSFSFMNIFSTAAVSLKIHKLSPYMCVKGNILAWYCFSARVSGNFCFASRIFFLKLVFLVSSKAHVYEFIGKMYCKRKISSPFYLHKSLKKLCFYTAFLIVMTVNVCVWKTAQKR